MVIGVIVNPIAGMGGRVGLKGTEPSVVADAMSRGATPVSPARAAEALEQLLPIASDTFDLLVWSEEMGGQVARDVGLSPIVLTTGAGVGETTALDTGAAAMEMSRRRVSLLLFAGGDGTAVDILRAVGGEISVLGIPAGVKMHSAVFGVTPRSAGRVARMVIENRVDDIREAEVADVDEELLRHGIVSPRLYGTLRVPVEPRLVQHLKARSEPDNAAVIRDIAESVARGMTDGVLTIVGPGTTTTAILRHIGIESTLVGVDAVLGRTIVARDAGEADLLRWLEATPHAQILVAPVGGQGFVFGRGNQQISPAVLRRVGAANVRVVATERKLAALHGRPLLVDTGDPVVDAALGGYTKVMVGSRREIVYPIGSDGLSA